MIAKWTNTDFAGVHAKTADSLTGTSSFGMSGVNAHVLLKNASTSSHTSSCQPQRSMQRSRYHISPMPHRLMLSFQATSHSGLIRFVLDMSHAAVAYLRDHSCGGQPIMPLVAWLESTAGATFLLQDQASAVGLTHLIGPTAYHLVGASGGARLNSQASLAINPNDASVMVDHAPVGVKHSGSAALFHGQLSKLDSQALAPGHMTMQRQALKHLNAGVARALVSDQKATAAASRSDLASTGLIAELPLSMTDGYHMPPAASAAAAMLPLISACGHAFLADPPRCLSGAAACLLTNAQQGISTLSGASITTATATSMQMTEPSASRPAKPSALAFALNGMTWARPDVSTATSRGMQHGYVAKAAQAIYRVSWHATEPCLQDASKIIGISGAVTLRRSGRQGLRQLHARAGGRSHAAPSHAQQATTSAANFLQILRHHRLLRRQAISVSHASAVHATPERALDAADMAPASVQGIVRCFPYELPQMQVSLHQTDAHAPGMALHSGVSISMPKGAETSDVVGDAFGRALQQGVMSLPRMAYHSIPATPQDTYTGVMPPESLPSTSSKPTCDGRFSTPGAQSGFMVTGGLSGLGLMSAEWMLQNGSAHAVLLGRTGRMAGLAEATAVSSTVSCTHAMRCDVAVSTEAQAAAAAASCGGWQLGGVLHAAGLQASL